MLYVFQKNLFKYKIFLKIIFILFIFVILFFSLFTNSFAAYPKLISTIIAAFDQIKTWILRISTPAAAVSVGSGVFMKKFSFGDEERIKTGKKIIRGSLFSYAFILCIDLVLSAIELLASKGGE